MSLYSVPNIFDDATHQALDKEVNDQVEAIISEPLGNADYIFLLEAIVERSNGTLDPKYYSFCAAGYLLLRQPELRIMLDAAWNNRSYRDIRNLEILQAPRPSIAEDAYSFRCKEQVWYDSTFTGHPMNWGAWTETHSSKDGESSYSKPRGMKRKACDMAT